MKLKKTISIIFTVIVISLLFCMTASAADGTQTYYCHICGENHTGSFSNYITEWAWEVNDTVYGGDIFSSSTNEVLRFSISGSSQENGDAFDKELAVSFKKLWDAIEIPYNNLALVGKMLLVIYVMVQTLRETSIKNLHLEPVFKMLMKMMIGVIIIDNGYVILTALLNLSSSIFTVIKNGTISTKGTGSCNFNEALDYGILDALSSIMTNILPFLIMQIARVLVYIAAWSRILEICVRAMFTPVGIADIVTKGLHGNGMRYIRKFFSCALQGAVIMASVKVYSAAYGAIQFNSWVVQAAMSLVLVVIVFKAKDFCDSVAGV